MALIPFGRLENKSFERLHNFPKIKGLVSAKVNALLTQSPKKGLSLSTYQTILFLIDPEQATEPKRTAFTIAEIILCQSSLSLEEKAVG